VRLSPRTNKPPATNSVVAECSGPGISESSTPPMLGATFFRDFNHAVRLTRLIDAVGLAASTGTRQQAGYDHPTNPLISGKHSAVVAESCESRRPEETAYGCSSPMLHDSPGSAAKVDSHSPRMA
jgi:hypothetical protein